MAGAEAVETAVGVGEAHEAGWGRRNAVASRVEDVGETNDASVHGFAVVDSAVVAEDSRAVAAAGRVALQGPEACTVSVAALGLVSQERGLSLRFPRFIKVRDDKSIFDASTPEFLAKMWHNQERKGKDYTGVDDGELVDVDVESYAGSDDIEEIP